jgi:hypothetical protein
MPGRLFASPKVSRGGKRTGRTPHQLDGKTYRFDVRGRNLVFAAAYTLSAWKGRHP